MARNTSAPRTRNSAKYGVVAGVHSPEVYNSFDDPREGVVLYDQEAKNLRYFNGTNFVEISDSTQYHFSVILTTPLNLTTVSVGNTLTYTDSEIEGLDWVSGQRIVFQHDINDRIVGTVSAYDADAGTIAFIVDSKTGTGTFSQWSGSFIGDAAIDGRLVIPIIGTVSNWTALNAATASLNPSVGDMVYVSNPEGKNAAGNIGLPTWLGGSYAPAGFYMYGSTVDPDNNSRWIFSKEGIVNSINASLGRLVPEGGSTGQVLIRTASGYEWQTAAITGAAAGFGTPTATNIPNNSDGTAGTATVTATGPDTAKVFNLGIPVGITPIIGSTVTAVEGGTRVQFTQSVAGTVTNVGAPFVIPRANTILSNQSDPSDGIGNNGDFYINTVTLRIFGPKNESAQSPATQWGTGRAISQRLQSTDESGAAVTLNTFTNNTLTNVTPGGAVEVVSDSSKQDRSTGLDSLSGLATTDNHFILGDGTNGWTSVAPSAALEALGINDFPNIVFTRENTTAGTFNIGDRQQVEIPDGPIGTRVLKNISGDVRIGRRNADGTYEFQDSSGVFQSLDDSIAGNDPDFELFIPGHYTSTNTAGWTRGDDFGYNADDGTFDIPGHDGIPLGAGGGDDVSITNGTAVPGQYVSGASNEDGAITLTRVSLPPQRDDESIHDLVGSMFTGNTETGISATYDDANDKINLVVSGGGGGNQIVHLTSSPQDIPAGGFVIAFNGELLRNQSGATITGVTQGTTLTTTGTTPPWRKVQPDGFIASIVESPDGTFTATDDDGNTITWTEGSGTGGGIVTGISQSANETVTTFANTGTTPSIVIDAAQVDVEPVANNGQTTVGSFRMARFNHNVVAVNISSADIDLQTVITDVGTGLTDNNFYPALDGNNSWEVIEVGDYHPTQNPNGHLLHTDLNNSTFSLSDIHTSTSNHTNLLNLDGYYDDSVTTGSAPTILYLDISGTSLNIRAQVNALFNYFDAGNRGLTDTISRGTSVNVPASSTGSNTIMTLGTGSIDLSGKTITISQTSDREGNPVLEIPYSSTDNRRGIQSQHPGFVTARFLTTDTTVTTTTIGGNAVIDSPDGTIDITLANSDATTPHDTLSIDIASGSRPAITDTNVTVGTVPSGTAPNGSITNGRLNINVPVAGAAVPFSGALTGNLGVSGTSTLAGNVTAEANSTVEGDFDVQGATTLASLSVSAGIDTAFNGTGTSLTTLNPTGGVGRSSFLENSLYAWPITSTGRFVAETNQTIAVAGVNTTVVRTEYSNVQETPSNIWYEFIGVRLNGARTAFLEDTEGSVYSNNTNPFAAGAITIPAF